MKKLFGSLLVLISLSSCATTTNESFLSLSNKGILPLSSSNAFVGANLFLADEFTKSSHLFNFLKQRGAPSAIQLEGARFGEPHLLMYYPREKEMYMADLHADESSYQWIIRGPFRIEHKDYRMLARTLQGHADEPQFYYRKKSFRFRPTLAELAKLNATPTPLPTPVPTKRPVRKPSKVITNLEAAQGTPTPDASQPFKPLNVDQQAIAMAQGFAERAPNGDVIHTVRADGETLERIAEWYTGSAANYKELARLNGFVEGSKPQPGTRIQIPLRMVKQFKALK